MNELAPRTHRQNGAPASASREFCAGMRREVPVRIGDVRVAGAGSVLVAIGLGSCVAVALWDAEAGVGGLAHVMLPHPTGPAREAPAGRFATTAIPALVESMEAAGAVRERLRGRLAGGASMFRDVLEGEGLRLGKRNVVAVRAALAAAGVPVDGEDVLGTWGRSVFLRTTDGRLLVTAVSQDDVLL